MIAMIAESEAWTNIRPYVNQWSGRCTQPLSLVKLAHQLREALCGLGPDLFVHFDVPATSIGRVVRRKHDVINAYS
jgi:hypothetical protein